MAEVKQRSLSGAIEYAAKVFQKLVVLQDCLYTTGTIDMCRCFTCGDPVPRSIRLHAGHWKKRSNHSVLFERVNCAAQCRSCNINCHGNMSIFRQKAIERWGEPAVNRIEIMAKQVKHWSFLEIDAMVKNWRVEIKKMEK